MNEAREALLAYTESGVHDPDRHKDLLGDLEQKQNEFQALVKSGGNS